MVQTLIQSYPEGLNIADNNGLTPMFYAAALSSSVMLEYLCTTRPNCLTRCKLHGTNISHHLIFHNCKKM